MPHSSTREINVLDRGTEDDAAAAIASAIDLAPTVETAWSNLGRAARGTRIVLPRTTNPYVVNTQIDIPADKIVEIVAQTAHGARIEYTGAGSYAFSVLGGQRPVGFRGLAFDGGGVKYQANNRVEQYIRDCLFDGIAAPAIATEGASVINVEIARCFFSENAGGVHVLHSDCDNWWIKECTFVRGTDADVATLSTGVKMIDCDFETRATSAPNAPYVRIGASLARIIDCRFGDETTAGYAPPARSVVIGPESGASATTIEDITLRDNHFRGTNGTLSASEADAALRLSAPTRGLVMDGNHFQAYNSALVDEYFYDDDATTKAYATNARGNRWRDNPVAPTHTGKIFSEGGIGFNGVGA